MGLSDFMRDWLKENGWSNEQIKAYEKTINQNDTRTLSERLMGYKWDHLDKNVRDTCKK